jgi:hypothetical protein
MGQAPVYVPQDDRPLPAEPIDLVAIDLDGTLLRSDRSVGLRSAEAITKVTDLGVKVVVSTGRSPRGAKHVYQALGLNTLMVAHNGALVVDPDKRWAIVQHLTLAGQVAYRAMRVARRVMPRLAVGVELLNRCFTDKVGSRLEREPTLVYRPRVTQHLESVLNQPITKLLFVGEPHVLGGVQMALVDQLPGELSFALSHPHLLQVVAPHANKAVGLECVCHYYNVPRHRTMAIGDAPNDLPMINWAGLGIAVQNGWEDVRTAAAFVVASNNDEGVAEAIYRYVLMR